MATKKAPAKTTTPSDPVPKKAPRADAVNRKGEKKPEPAAKKTRAPRSPAKKILAEKAKKDREKKDMGRPTLLTPERQADICKAIRAGNFMDTAAAYAGINPDTLRDWMRRGARGESPELIDFSASVKRALSESEVTGIARIRSAAADSWQAEAWYMERRFRERWGRTLNVTNDLKDKSTEELLALLEDADTAGTP